MQDNTISLDLDELNLQLNKFSHHVLNLLENIRNNSVINPNLLNLALNLKDNILEIDGVGVSRAVDEMLRIIIPGFAYTYGPRSFPWIVGGVQLFIVNVVTL